MLKINEITRLDLGIQGENAARTIEIDMSAWADAHPNGTIAVYHKRNGDASAAETTGAAYDSETKVLTWTPNGTDTYYSGEGTAEVQLTESGVVKKSREVKTYVRPSMVLNGNPGSVIVTEIDPPEEEGTYVLKCTVTSSAVTYSWVAEE